VKVLALLRATETEINVALWANTIQLERKVLTLAFFYKAISPKTQAMWLLYVYALLTLMVSHDNLPFLV